MKIEMEDVKISLSRAGKFMYSITIEDMINDINESINEDYTKEQCYRDLILISMFNTSKFIKFVIHNIKSNNKEDLDIIVSNMNLLTEEVFRLLLDEEIGFNYIIENFNKVLKNITDDQKYILISKIIKKENGIDFIINQIDNNNLLKNAGQYGRSIIIQELFKKNKTDVIINNFQDFFIDGIEFSILQELINKGIGEDKILENKKRIIENSKGKSLAFFINWLKQKNEFSKEDITLEQFIKQVYFDITDPVNLQMLQILYRELLEKQNLGLEDINFLQTGEYSKVYKVGEFCIKTGEIRQNYIIPYHRRILQPLVRQETTQRNSTNFMYLEIQNIVDSRWYKGLTEEEIEEEMYKVYKEMRQDGIIWTDIKKENLGRLLKTNTSNYITKTLKGDLEELEETYKKEGTLKKHETEEELQIEDSAIGFKGRKKEEPLKKGELVVLDSDFIFGIKGKNTISNISTIDLDEEIRTTVPSKWVLFEKRYRHEIEQKIKNESTERNKSQLL